MKLSDFVEFCDKFTIENKAVFYKNPNSAAKKFRKEFRDTFGVTIKHFGFDLWIGFNDMEIVTVENGDIAVAGVMYFAEGKFESNYANESEFPV